MVGYVVKIAAEMGVQKVVAIMMNENYRAIKLVEKMGFFLKHKNDGTVVGTLSL